MPTPPRPSRSSRLLAALIALALATVARASSYYVDVVSGVDDAGRDGLSAATSWKTVTYAISRANDGGTHEILLLAGEYSVASGETFPLQLPINVSLRGAGPDLTTIRNSFGTDLGTIRWAVRSGQTVIAPPTVTELTVVHDRFEELPRGTGIALSVSDVSAAPRLTNVVIRDAAIGISLLSDSYLATTTMTPTVERCTITGSIWGVLSTAYTTGGGRSQMNPIIVNTIAADALSDGMVFETAANWDLAPGQRANATSEPVLTHCTITDSLGSAILLDNSNGYIAYRAGNINPRITNCILAGNGDYAVNEYTSSSDPAAFDKNLIGGNGTALYLDEGTTELTLLADVPGAGNIDARPLFLRGAAPNYHLRADSPGVDAALPGLATVDVDAQPRPTDSNLDGTAASEIGADETPPCAVSAVIDPALPAPRCGIEGPLDFSATLSAPTTGFSCTGLTYEWFADGVSLGVTDPTFTADPVRTTTYTVVVTCPDHPNCFDAAQATVVVRELPAVDATAGTGPGSEYETCIAHDARDVTIPLQGTATAMEDGSALTSTLWTSTAGVLVGEAALTPFLSVINDGANQAVEVTLTATDTNGCVASSTAMVRVWRGPLVLPMPPLTTCQTPDAPQTVIPVTGDAQVPAGSAIVAWSWRATVGSFDDPRAQSPNLTLVNLPLSRTTTLTLTATDDHGCTSEAQTTVTLNPSPGGVSPGGPYQQGEDVSGTTPFALCGSASSGAGNVFSWTTDLGTFQESGAQSADGQCVTLLVTNTGADQVATVCVTVTAANGCSTTRCTQASTRTGAIRPPNDVGDTLRVFKQPADATLRWTNAPIDSTHDLASTYDVWESLARRPVAGTWAQRAGATRIPAGSGTTSHADAGLVDLAGDDLIFLKVVSENVGGYSCANPAGLLPDCP